MFKESKKVSLQQKIYIFLTFSLYNINLLLSVNLL